MNPNHDDKGRFASEGGAGAFHPIDYRAAKVKIGEFFSRPAVVVPLSAQLPVTRVTHETIALKDLEPAQDVVFRDRVSSVSNAPITVVRGIDVHGKTRNIVFDGHHRVARLVQQGKTHTQATIHHADAKYMRQFGV